MKAVNGTGGTAWRRRAGSRWLAVSIAWLAGCAAPVASPVAKPPRVLAPAAPAARPPIVRWHPPVALCGASVRPASDGRVFGHLRYPEVASETLVAAPDRFGAECRMHPAVRADLERLLAAADADPAVAGRLRAVSCHRGEALQVQTFCGGIGPDGSATLSERAWSSAPPGFSEHATGYAIDFGTRDANGCRDAEACFGNTAAGRWLFAHGARFGFELSFPAGNRQGVKWEPWHWRWVGDARAPGAAAARAVFAGARSRFPAAPVVR